MVRTRIAVVAGCLMLGTFAAVLATPPLTKFKFKDWMPEGAGFQLTPNVDGMAILRKDSDGVSRLTLSLHGLEPNKSYSVFITRPGSDDPTWNSPHVFSSNSHGRANAHVEFVEGDAEGDPTIRVYVWDGIRHPLGGDSPDDVVTYNEARAVTITTP